MEEKICCLLTDPMILPITRGRLRVRLRAAIRRAMKQGCNTFVSTLETETDLLFAQLVLDEAASHHGLRLEAALACAQDAIDSGVVMHAILHRCSGMSVHGTKNEVCSRLCRDHAMLRLADCALVVQPINQPPHTLEYAQILQKPIDFLTL